MGCWGSKLHLRSHASQAAKALDLERFDRPSSSLSQGSMVELAIARNGIALEPGPTVCLSSAARLRGGHPIRRDCCTCGPRPAMCSASLTSPVSGVAADRGRVPCGIRCREGTEGPKGELARWG